MSRAHVTATSETVSVGLVRHRLAMPSNPASNLDRDVDDVLCGQEAGTQGIQQPVPLSRHRQEEA